MLAKALIRSSGEADFRQIRSPENRVFQRSTGPSTWYGRRLRPSVSAMPALFVPLDQKLR